MRRKSNTKTNVQSLQMYTFWTGLVSTIISLVHVLVIALKN